ncbi:MULTISPECIES: hypothetical protein [Oscillatoriales]|nr:MULTISPECIES: hypothetical protein [Oscillatoriales]
MKNDSSFRSGFWIFFQESIEQEIRRLTTKMVSKLTLRVKKFPSLPIEQG